MRKLILFLLILLSLAMAAGARAAEPVCELDFACTADCDPVWWGTAPQFRLICQVVIIDYYNVHYTFTTDPIESDYMVRGIGTGSLVAWRHTWAERIGAVSVYTRPAELQYFPIIY